MSQKIQTPYGQFKSIADATTFIEIHHGPDFVKTYPDYSFPYNQVKMGHHGGGTNHSTRHYIYNVVLDLIGSATSGRRKPKAGWARIK